MHATLLYVLFFLSGISGLIYQVAWVRQFGHVFGNTVHSASLVVAVFMLGLGVGSYLLGWWADRRYAGGPESLLWAYALIGADSLSPSCRSALHDAVREFEAALALDPDHANARLNLMQLHVDDAVAHLDAGRVDEAAAAARDNLARARAALE